MTIEIKTGIPVQCIHATDAYNSPSNESSDRRQHAAKLKTSCSSDSFVSGTSLWLLMMMAAGNDRADTIITLDDATTSWRGSLTSSTVIEVTVTT